MLYFVAYNKGNRQW